MVSVEIMAEACSLLAGSAGVQVIENVRAFDWIALDDEALTLEVRAEVVDAERARLSRDDLQRPSEPVVSADFQFEPTLASPAPWRRSAPARPSVWSGPELYTTGMFHGPVFQSVRQHRRLERRRHRCRAVRGRPEGLLRGRRARRG